MPLVLLALVFNVSKESPRLALLIPPIVGMQFTQNAQYCSLYSYIIVSRWILLRVSIHKGLTSGNQTKPYHIKSQIYILNILLFYSTSTVYKSG
jgi:hypothetical protein